MSEDAIEFPLIIYNRHENYDEYLYFTAPDIDGQCTCNVISAFDETTLIAGISKMTVEEVMSLYDRSKIVSKDLWRDVVKHAERYIASFR